MKAVVAAFNQEKALVGAFSVITNLRMELFEALPGEPPAAAPGLDVGGDGLPPLGGGAALPHHVVVAPLRQQPEVL